MKLWEYSKESLAALKNHLGEIEWTRFAFAGKCMSCGEHFGGVVEMSVMAWAESTMERGIEEWMCSGSE